MTFSIKERAQQALSLMDLTSLNDNDTDEVIIKLCHSAKTEFTVPAAVCVYPRFIPIAKHTLKQQGTAGIKVATVTNFPHGNDNIEIAVAETRAAVAYGADEVDVVFPYRALLAGNEEVGVELVKQCKEACGNILLKVIIETGELKTAENIRKASELAIQGGADFIKTSTGKVAVNATLAFAEVMLQVIADMGVADKVGFKAAGGVRSVEDATLYIELAERILGKTWVSAEHFRFGASGLLGSLLNVLEGKDSTESTSAY